MHVKALFLFFYENQKLIINFSCNGNLFSFSNIENNFLFDNIRLINGSCGFILGTSDVYIWKAGVYHVSYRIFHLEPLQNAIFMNNVIVTGSIVGDQLSATVLSNTLLLSVSDSDITEPTSLSPSGFGALIQIRNHSSFSPIIHIDGHTGSGSQIGQSNINLVIFHLHSY